MVVYDLARQQIGWTSYDCKSFSSGLGFLSCALKQEELLEQFLITTESPAGSRSVNVSTTSSSGKNEIVTVNAGQPMKRSDSLLWIVTTSVLYTLMLSSTYLRC
ncbi:hypothetical protein CDL15_Pgr025136 [Punica granatum]|uniref:Peptidase A1 domain-containing protein n=1 Tax=Punica granatum TaxID=22663 RepID=A0A218W8Y0_PUNGR|nr:hypothetical protein CDL15_Pgr025136 [Punica granatum]